MDKLDILKEDSYILFENRICLVLTTNISDHFGVTSKQILIGNRKALIFKSSTLFLEWQQL